MTLLQIWRPLLQLMIRTAECLGAWIHPGGPLSLVGSYLHLFLSRLESRLAMGFACGTVLLCCETEAGLGKGSMIRICFCRAYPFFFLGAFHPRCPGISRVEVFPSTISPCVISAVLGGDTRKRSTLDQSPGEWATVFCTNVRRPPFPTISGRGRTLVCACDRESAMSSQSRR